MSGGWSCPFHSKAVFKVSDKTGRPFVGCPDCHTFARDRAPLAAQAEPDGIGRLLDAMYAPQPLARYDDDLPF